MPWKRQLLLCSHAGIAEPWKNIATSKICVTVFKMLVWAKRHYQSLCRGIKPTSQITLFIISLGLFPSNLENVWLFLYLKGVCPVLKQEYKICTKKAMCHDRQSLGFWRVVALLLLKIVQPSSELHFLFSSLRLFPPPSSCSIVLSLMIKPGFVPRYCFQNCWHSRCENTGSENHEGINEQICSMLGVADVLVLNIYSPVVRRDKPNSTGTLLKRISCKLHWKWILYAIH